MEISVPARDATRVDGGGERRRVEGGGGTGQAAQATSSNAHVRVAVRDRPGPLTYITRGVYRSRIYESRPTSDTRPRQVGAGRVAGRVRSGRSLGTLYLPACLPLVKRAKST